MDFPLAFIQQMQQLLSEDFTPFTEAHEQDVPVSVRVNDKLPLKPSTERVSWSSAGYYLPERPLFTLDPLLHAGAYYVQEASSMFLEQLLVQFIDKSSVVLDLSAAPGGKSTLISQYLADEGLLVCNEIIRSRAYVLAENIIKWGNSNCVVSNNAPKDFASLPSFFDAMVVDAPCSGEGMFRKDGGAIAEWSEQNVLMCAARQQDILRDAWDSLRTGGVLIYSTCTYNRLENEENIAWIEEELGAELLMPDLSAFPEITVTDKGLRFFPHKTKGEGFFVAVLRKTAAAPLPKRAKKEKNRLEAKLSLEMISLKRQLRRPDEFELLLSGELISALPKKQAEKIKILQRSLHLLHSGVSLATVKGRDLIPHISLALSKELDTEHVKSVEVNKVTALRFLRREAILLPEAPKGFLLIKYDSLPLGWVKNLGSRSNNLYPNEWRIRMEIE